MTIIADIPEVRDLLKSAIKKAQRKSAQMSGKSKFSMIKKRELYKVESVGTAISNKLEAIVKNSANLDNLPSFQKEMCHILFDINRTKRALHSVYWASKKILELSKEYGKKMRKTREIDDITKKRKQFEARVESILKQISADVDVLKKAHIKAKQIPSIKDMPSIVIAGYPNVGKSSILNALSDSKVRIEPYPFTTKQLLVGYMKSRYKRIQLIDTPGVFDRPLKRMNRIEKQAIAAFRHLGKNMLFLIDGSETCGYAIKEQVALLKSIKDRFKPNIFVVVNKKDLIEKPLDIEHDMIVSAHNINDMHMLKERLFDLCE